MFVFCTYKRVYNIYTHTYIYDIGQGKSKFYYFEKKFLLNREKFSQFENYFNDNVAVNVIIMRRFVGWDKDVNPVKRELTDRDVRKHLWLKQGISTKVERRAKRSAKETSTICLYMGLKMITLQGRTLNSRRVIFLLLSDLGTTTSTLIPFQTRKLQK